MATDICGVESIHTDECFCQIYIIMMSKEMVIRMGLADRSWHHSVMIQKRIT
jgi:hypothetical protein